MIKRIGSILLSLILVAAIAGCGGGATSTPTPKPGQPLDPQGNWVFTITSTSTNVQLAGLLYELSPPVVTSNPLAQVDSTGHCFNGFNVNGQASGTNSITLNVQQFGAVGENVAFTLTGTIATDQAHMSGTWALSSSTPPDGCLGNPSGTWTAQLLTPATGNWSGSVASGSTTLQVSAALTEVTDQTAPNLGMITGTITATGAPCFPTATTFTVPPFSASSTVPESEHSGEQLLLNTVPLSDGTTLTLIGQETTDGTSYSLPTSTGPGFKITGGTCGGLQLNGTLAHN